MNSIEPVSEAKFAADYRSLANARLWPNPAIHQISANARFRCIDVFHPQTLIGGNISISIR